MSHRLFREAEKRVSDPNETDQLIEVRENEQYLYSGVEFHAKRGVMEKERFVGMNGTGFFDWQQSKVTFPAKTTITGDAVPMDFAQWDDRPSDTGSNPVFLQVKIIAHNALERADDPIVLDQI